MSQKTLLLCIGAQKAGTTWLAEQLRVHPNFFVPPIKELHHFDSIFRGHIIKHRNNRIRILKKTLENCNVKKLQNLKYRLKVKWLTQYAIVEKNTPEWYKSLFDDAYSSKEQPVIKCDITPEYAILNEDGFSQMCKAYDRVKFVFIMREPISRSWSAIKYFNKNNPGKNVMGSKESILAFLNSKDTMQRSDYVNTVRLLKKFVPDEDCLLAFYEDIFRNSDSQSHFLKKVCDHVNVDFDGKIFSESINTRINVSTSKVMPDYVKDSLSEHYVKQKEELRRIINLELPNEWK